ncbi:MAG: hypothetical protein D6689_04445 [Deltaproteobacteria bacterium]|nr:MAG: hypothetical protein D6689_04445 [Deltaproteobacteria bacterium]
MVDAGSPGLADGGRRPPPPDEFADAAPAEACDKMDILFVIDNSGSMGEEQDNLAANFPRFIEVLDSFVAENGNPIDYRVAVTSTAVTKSWTQETLPGFPPIPESQSGDDGALLQRCGMTRRWVEKSDPDPSGTFSCAAVLGSDGANQEMPLEAIRLAFGDRMADGTNAGFLREDALLAIVILTDENDCSRQDDNFTLTFGQDVCDTTAPVPPYAQFLDTVTGAPGRWAVAVIAGPGPGSCSSEFGNAEEATRLIEFAGLAGENGVVSSICEGDLTVGLRDALMTFETACNQLPPID